MNPSSGLGQNGRKPLGQSDCRTGQDGLATILRVHHGRLIMMLDIKFEQNSSGSFRDTVSDGRTNALTDERPDGRTDGAHFIVPLPNIKGDNKRWPKNT